MLLKSTDVEFKKYKVACCKAETEPFKCDWLFTIHFKAIYGLFVPAQVYTFNARTHRMRLRMVKAARKKGP